MNPFDEPPEAEAVAASQQAKKASDLASLSAAARSNRRVGYILRDHHVASRRMLESKISEAGRGQYRVPPRELGAEITKMLQRGEIVIAKETDGVLPDFFALPTAAEKTIAKRLAEVTALYEVFLNYASRSNECGQAGEAMLKKAFVEAGNFRILSDRWGDVIGYNGIALENPSDGLVLASNPLTVGRSAADAVALVEVKNLREWTYPHDYRVWRLIRNAYLLDVVAIYVNRRIASTTFGYTFKNVGALGIETFGQFAPAAAADRLAGVKHKDGLGFHDITFEEAPSASLVRRLDLLASRVVAARMRMLEVREIVEPYLEQLADPGYRDPWRKKLFDQLGGELRAHDRGEEENDESDESEADWGDEF